MNSAVTNTIAVIVGGIGAYTYFHVGESGVSPESKCEYTHPWTTDALSLIAGSVGMYYGFKHDEPILTGVGSSIFILHVAQFSANRVIKRISGD